MPSNNKKSKKKEPQLKKTKENRLFDNLLKIVEQFMSGKNYVAMTEPELFERLSFPEQHRELLGLILDELHAKKIVSIDRNRYSLNKSLNELVTGTIKVHSRGFGFVQPQDKAKFKEDIFIPKHLIMNAVDGDLVEVIVDTGAISEKGPEGKVVTILARGRTHIAGVIKSVNNYGEIIAVVPLLGFTQRVVVSPTTEIDLKVGDRVVMEVTDWGTKETETLCKYSHYIGHISDPSCDIKAAIEEFEIRSDFSQHTIEEAKSMGTRVALAEIKDRVDYRDMEVFTIDPDTAKDFDDAVHLIKDEHGQYHLGVHIADVSHYVRLGTALDEEAIMRCNSTYFPGTCIPMLPPILSDNLCSLKPSVNRLTVSVLITFDRDGNEIDYKIHKSVIKSKKRFTYKEAKEVLDGKKASKHKPTLELMVELCGLLKKKRFERGSIEFALPELVILVNDKGVPTGTEYISYDITHQLIEEFMLKANEKVATHLSKRGRGLAYRVHDIPAEDGMKEFAVLAKAFGFNLSETPTNSEIQMMFEEAMNSPYGPYLATSYIRRMRLAIYSPDNIGHFGLGLTHYTHFTSPIRRYIDLVVHRTLFDETKTYEELGQIAANCSEQERISARAEQNVKQLKKLRLLEDIHQKDPKKQYEAVVTKVRNFGVVFEVLELMLESYLHVSELDGDYYVYDDKSVSLQGRHTGKNFTAGNKILVMVNKIDFISLESTWHLVPEFSDEESSRRPNANRSSYSRGKGNKRNKSFDREKPNKKHKSDDKEKTDTNLKSVNRIKSEQSFSRPTDRPVPKSRAKDFFIPKPKSAGGASLKKSSSKPPVKVDKKIIKIKKKK